MTELRRKVAVLERSLRRQAALTADAELRLARACPRNSAADSNIKSMVLELEHSRTASTNLQRSNRQLQAELEVNMIRWICPCLSHLSQWHVTARHRIWQRLFVSPDHACAWLQRNSVPHG